MRLDGVKSKRDKGYKHFTKVGYAKGSDMKEIPRWAADDALVSRVVKQQRIDMNPDLIFGKLKPKT